MDRIVPSRLHIICFNDVMLIKKYINIFKHRTNNFADPSGCAVWGVVARLLRFRAGILRGA